MLINQSRAIDPQQKFHALVSAGANPDDARELIARDAERLAATYRGQMATPITKPVAAAPAVPTGARGYASKPAPVAAPAATPKVQGNPFADAIVAQVQAHVAGYNLHVATGGNPETWNPIGVAPSLNKPPAVNAQDAELAAVEARLGIARPTAAISFNPSTGIQQFGAMTPVAAKPREQQNAQLDEAFGLLQGGGVVMKNGVQQFGVFQVAK